MREAVKGADGWLKQGSAKDKDGEDVEHRLMTAIAANDVSEKADADAVLETVRTRCAELAADSLFDSAKTQLDAKAIVEAVALLHRYVADRHATKKPEAEQLLADCDLATSEIAALQTLMAMSDERFVQFRNTGKLDDRKITPPILEEIRATTLRRNLETANQRREEDKIAEENRQESERLARAAAAEAALRTAKAKEDIAKAKEDEVAKRKLEQAIAHSKEAVAVGKIQALGPAALAWAAENDSDADVKRKAIERLGEIGGLRGIAAIGRTLLQPGIDPETAKAAEDSLLKLLPAVGSSLTPNTSFLLYDVHRLGNKRVSPAIESAWEASGFKQYFTAKEKI